MPWNHRTFWLLPLIIGALLAIPILVVSLSRVGVVYSRHFHGGRRERLFLAAFGFFTAALVVRGITIAIHYDIGPFHDVEMHGRHIHHLVWGILLLLLDGYAWLSGIDRGDSGWARFAGRVTSIVYGVAAALTLDEFALWLNLRDVYWQREGRESFEALALFGGLLGIGLFGRQFFFGILRECTRLVRGRPA
jgi:hypothetical protein